VLDRVLEQLVEDGRSVDQVVAGGFERGLVRRVANMVQNSEYKRRQMPPGLIVTRKAFGPGRRYPIAQRYRA
jgi:NAD+ synthase (glutamine-hydrolysing)